MMQFCVVLFMSRLLASINDDRIISGIFYNCMIFSCIFSPFFLHLAQRGQEAAFSKQNPQSGRLRAGPKRINH